MRGLGRAPGEAREDVRLDREPLRGRVSREDVAAVLVGLLHEPRSVRAVLYVIAGDRTVDEALAAVLTGR